MNRTLIGVTLLGAGLGLLLGRALPGLAALWPLGLVLGSLWLWRAGWARASLPALVLALSAGLVLGSGTAVPGNWGWFGGTSRAAVYESSRAEAEQWRDLRHALITNRAGNVTVQVGDTRIWARYVREQGSARPPRMPEMTYDAESGTLTVVGIPPETAEGVRADLEIALPEGVRLELRTGAGSVTVSGVGEADLGTGAGDIQVRGVAGAVTAITEVGNITVAGVQGSVSARADVGTVSVALEQPATAPITAETRVGDVLLTLPRTSDVAVRATSGLRSFGGDLERLTAEEYRLTLGTGRYPVLLQTDVGRVEARTR